MLSWNTNGTMRLRLPPKQERRVANFGREDALNGNAAKTHAQYPMESTFCCERDKKATKRIGLPADATRSFAGWWEAILEPARR